MDGLEEGGVELAGGEGVEPRGGDFVLGDADEGFVDGLLVGEEILGDDFLKAGVLADGFVDEGLDEGLSQGVAGGGDEVEPAGGEAGGEKGNGNDVAFELACFGVSEEEFAVGEDVWSSDVELLLEGFLLTQNSGEVADDVSDGDGLAAVTGPLGGDHEGEFFGKVADDFEGGRAGADDDGGAEGGDRNGALAEEGVDFFAGGEVGGELAIGDEATEVDDLFAVDPFGEAACAVGLALGEVAAGAHGVEKVVGGVEVVGDRREIAEEVTFEEGELFALDELLKLGRRETGDGANNAGDAVACLKESGEEAHADVAVGAGEEDMHFFGGG